VRAAAPEKPQRQPRDERNSSWSQQASVVTGHAPLVLREAEREQLGWFDLNTDLVRAGDGEIGIAADSVDRALGRWRYAPKSKTPTRHTLSS
jgi:hypothetical protein